jgi:hypothetical protein
MAIGAIFNSYLSCVKSITQWKTNTLQQNVMAVFSCAAPIGVAVALYCFRDSLYGRFKKGPPSVKEVPAQYAELYLNISGQVGGFRQDRDEVLNELIEVVNRPEFQTNPKKYVAELVQKRGATEEIRPRSSDGISDRLLPLMAEYYAVSYVITTRLEKGGTYVQLSKVKE